MSSGFQAIKFVMLDFDPNWERMPYVTSYSFVHYEALKNGARLMVAFEGATGVMMTYMYQLAKGDEVYVLDQVIHIPARCIKQVPGNAIRCGRG
jgi:hypothetical protein